MRRERNAHAGRPALHPPARRGTIRTPPSPPTPGAMTGASVTLSLREARQLQQRLREARANPDFRAAGLELAALAAEAESAGLTRAAGFIRLRAAIRGVRLDRPEGQA